MKAWKMKKEVHLNLAAEKEELLEVEEILDSVKV